MNALNGELYLHDGEWTGIPDTYFEVRGAGLSGPVHYEVEFGYDTGPDGWVEIRLSYKDGLMPMRVVVGPEDRKAGLVLGEVFQVYTGIMTIRFGYHTPPAPPKPVAKWPKTRASQQPVIGAYPMQPTLDDEVWTDAEEIDADELDKLYDEWEQKDAPDSDLQMEINKLLGITKDDGEREPYALPAAPPRPEDPSGEHFREVMEEGGGWR